MIFNLTAAWSGPYTAGGADILQLLDGAVMISFGAGAPDSIGDPVIAGTLSLAPGQVFFARATDAAVTGRFYLGPAVVGATAPVNTVPPAITGVALVGQTLTLSNNGSWINDPSSFTRQWRRVGTAISGATGTTYLLAPADVGSTITITVTATNGSGSASATSAATGVVAAAPTVPATMVFADWRLLNSPSEGGNVLTVLLDVLPANGGSAII